MNLLNTIGSHKWFPVLFLFFSITIQIGFLSRTYEDWWFEDDTPHLAFVRDHSNPLAYFYDRELVAKLSLGHAVTPWFPFTFWVDRQISALSPLVAYLHTAASLFLAAWLLFVLLTRFIDRGYALATAWLWTLLPSTVVISEFLSTRHYLEGLILSLLSLLCAVEAVSEKRKKTIWWFILAGSFYLLACSAKEVFVSTTWALLIWFYLWKGRRGAALGIVTCGMAYAAYRFWALGLVGKNLSSNFLERYHLFLERLPQIFAGNPGGYLLFGIVIIPLVLLWRQRKLKLVHLLFAGLHLGIAMLTIFPVTANITAQYQELGTWYRVVFLLNTGLLVGLTWPFARLKSLSLSWAALVMASLILGWGAYKTATRWDDLKQVHTREARFYLDHPDRLLYSRLPATWYLWGVHQVYQPNREKHYIAWRINNGTPAEYILEQTEKYSEIWVYEDGAYRPDSALLARIRQNCLDRITPLDQPRD